MASETSELTFVRCPTCRSLVPASASRCRICNATLEAAGKGGDGEGQGAAGRVRQKTVTASADEVADIVAGASAPAQSTPPQGGIAGGEGESDFGGTNDDGFDPLGAYLQDLDSGDGQGAAVVSTPIQEPSVSVAASGGMLDDNDDFDLDLFDDPGFQEPVVKKPEPVAQRAPALEPEEDPLDFLDDPIIDEPSPPPVQRAPVEPKRAPVEARQEQSARPQVPQHQSKQAPRPQRDPAPTPKQSQPNNQPMRPKVAQPQQPPRQEARPAREEQPRRDRPQQGNQNQQRGGGDSGRSFAGPKPQQNNGGGQKQQPHHSQSQRQPAREEQETRHREDRQEPRRPHSGGPRAGKIQSGRLFGWLVSFENPDGRAIELRGGRFFITGSNIRDTDLILEDQSISTPHALMSITDRGMMVQDLMSDRGTFVRSRGDSQYRREDGIIEVQHGDWLRFGDVEFLVTIVPSGDF
jgi:hypothetical protein